MLEKKLTDEDYLKAILDGDSDKIIVKREGKLVDQYTSTEILTFLDGTIIHNEYISFMKYKDNECDSLAKTPRSKIEIVNPNSEKRILNKTDWIDFLSIGIEDNGIQ